MTALKLTADDIPFPCSVLDAVLKHCAGGGDSDAIPLELDELLSYLRAGEGGKQSARDIILAQAEALGDPAMPSHEHDALLTWLEKAEQRWHQQYPLEHELREVLQPLTPLFAAQALSNPLFLQPGAHALHRLLDAAQAAAIGWQPGLGRGAVPLKQQLERAVEELLSWWRESAGDPMDICERAIKQMQTERTRAARMSRRNADLEMGQAKTITARREAANMINRGLDIYPLPRSIESFLKGAWYESAQLVVLKYGTDSEQWQQMSAVTDTLLESMRSREDVGENRRQQVFELIAKLPRELRRWLLSLQHDQAALDRGIARIEAIHLSILKQEELEMDLLGFIAIEGSESGSEEAIPERIARIEVGEWFALQQADGMLRAQLAARIDVRAELLFTNHMGLKATVLDFRTFEDMLATKSAVPLYQGASYSLALAWAAGIENRDQLDLLAELAPVPEPPPSEELIPDPAPELETASAGDDAFELDADEFELDLDDEAVTHAATTTPEEGRGGWLQSESVETVTRALPQQEMTVREIDTDEAFELSFDDNGVDNPDALSESERQRIEEYLAKRRQRDSQAADSSTDSAFDFGVSPGTWLGFHDGDQPTMAQMAVFDQEQGLYIFVNREGRKLRELGREALKDLMDRGLVDILQTREN